MSSDSRTNGHGYIEEDDANVYYWSVARLWELAARLPIEPISLDDFDWSNENFQYLSPDDPMLWRTIGDEARRILEADLDYPVILSAEGNVMDGMHRILKCYIFGLPSVPAVRFGETPSPDRTTRRSEVGVTP